MPGEMTKRTRKLHKVKELYKTELCAAFERDGACKYGRDCYFAHDKKELRCRPLTAGIKTSIDNPTRSMHFKMFSRLCDSVLKNVPCVYGDRCFYAHSHEELTTARDEVIEARSQSSSSASEEDEVKPKIQGKRKSASKRDEQAEKEKEKENVSQQKRVQKRIKQKQLDTTRPKAILQAIATSAYRTTQKIEKTRKIMSTLPLSSSKVDSAKTKDKAINVVTNERERNCTRVWENQSPINWGPVLQDHPMFYMFRTMHFNGLKPDTSNIPKRQQYCSCYHMQYLCPSLYHYIKAHANGITIDQLGPKLRNVFPAMSGCSNDIILRHLLCCIDVWSDSVSLPGHVMICVN